MEKQVPYRGKNVVKSDENFEGMTTKNFPDNLLPDQNFYQKFYTPTKN